MHDGSEKTLEKVVLVELLKALVGDVTPVEKPTALP